MSESFSSLDYYIMIHTTSHTLLNKVIGEKSFQYSFMPTYVVQLNPPKNKATGLPR
jgi:hypothetical protein